jgi:hypothetical protein
VRRPPEEWDPTDEPGDLDDLEDEDDLFDEDEENDGLEGDGFDDPDDFDDDFDEEDLDDARLAHHVPASLFRVAGPGAVGRGLARPGGRGRAGAERAPGCW